MGRGRVRVGVRIRIRVRSMRRETGGVMVSAQMYNASLHTFVSLLFLFLVTPLIIVLLVYFSLPLILYVLRLLTLTIT